MWAVIQMLKLALPPITIWVDSKEVVEGWGADMPALSIGCRQRS